MGEFGWPPGAEQPLAICDVSACFLNESAMDQYGTRNNCIFDKCAYSVEQIKAALASIPRDDPTYGFYRNQNCIADKSCSNKKQLENSKWLDKVVYDFITPLVNENGQWKTIKAECEKNRIFEGLRCQRIMAEYHIETDLQNSVNKNACGTEKDWDLIGEWLNGCIKKGIEDDKTPNPGNSAVAYAFSVVKEARDKVRSKCKKYRNLHGLSVTGEKP